MDKTIIIAIVYALIIIIYVINDLRINKEKDKLIEEIVKFDKMLLKEKENIINIIKYAEKTKEQSYYTLEKIKKELSH